MPVDYTLVENADGSKTIWFGETERRHRMKWLIGLTLYPDRVVHRSDGQVLQPHAAAPLDPLLGQRGRPRQRRLPGDLSAERAGRDVSLEDRLHPLADTRGAVSRARLHGRRSQLVEELARLQFVLRLGPAGGLHGRLRPRAARRASSTWATITSSAGPSCGNGAPGHRDAPGTRSSPTTTARTPN